MKLMNTDEEDGTTGNGRLILRDKGDSEVKCIETSHMSDEGIHRTGTTTPGRRG